MIIIIIIIECFTGVINSCKEIQANYLQYREKEGVTLEFAMPSFLFAIYLLVLQHRFVHKIFLINLLNDAVGFSFVVIFGGVLQRRARLSTGKLIPFFFLRRTVSLKIAKSIINCNTASYQ